MLIAGSALKGYAIEADDGRIGTVDTLLFDDTTWKIRWLAIDTGGWLTGRTVLVHPSAIRASDHRRRHLSVSLTKAQVEASPDIASDQPVTMKMQTHIYSYYNWDPYWGPDFYGADASGLGMTGGYALRGAQGMDADTLQRGLDDGDPHLRSMASVQGYHIRATDGTIGHLENVLVEDETWAIRYLIVDTRDWWPGAHVLISPFAVAAVDWSERSIRLDISQAQVKASPPWDPLKLLDHMDERRLHEHYGWPGYGW